MASLVPGSTVECSSSIENFVIKFSVEKEESNYFKIFSHYVQQRSGANKLFKILKNSVKWPILYARELKLSANTVIQLSNAYDYFYGITKGLGFAKIPSDIEDLNEFYKDYKKSDDKNIARKRDKLAKKIVEIVADVSIFLQLGEMVGLYALGSVIGPAANFSGSLFMLFQHTVEPGTRDAICN